MSYRTPIGLAVLATVFISVGVQLANATDSLPRVVYPVKRTGAGAESSEPVHRRAESPQRRQWRERDSYESGIRPKKSDGERRRAQSSKAPEVRVASSAEETAAASRADYDGKSIVASGERIDGDSNGETLTLKNATLNRQPKRAVGRSSADDLNADAFRRTTVADGKHIVDDDSSMSTVRPATRARAVALKTPQHISTKNMDLADGVKEARIVNHDTGEPVTKDAAIGAAARASKTLAREVLVDVPTPDRRPAGGPTGPVDRIRQIPSSFAKEHQSHQFSDVILRPTNSAANQLPELPPLIQPPAPALAVGTPAQAAGQPDQMRLPPLLAPPPLIFPGVSGAAIEEGRRPAVAAGRRVHPAMPLQQPSVHPATPLQQPSVHRPATAAPFVDESDFDLLAPPRQPAPDSAYYSYQPVAFPAQQQLYQYLPAPPQQQQQQQQQQLQVQQQDPQQQQRYNWLGGQTILSSAGAPDGGDELRRSNARLDRCCRRQRLSDSCQSLCNFDTFTEKTLISAVVSGQCPAGEMSRAFHCASGRADHSQCCRRAGVDGRCMAFCETHRPTPPNLMEHIGCLHAFDTIKTCYRDHQIAALAIPSVDD